MEDVLFSITPKHLETGMRGIPVGYCTTSSVDPQKGLHYMGIPIDKLAQDRPEEVVYLLFKGRKPTKDELQVFCQHLRDRSHLSQEVIQSIKALPRIGHPMKLFSAALLIYGMFESTGDYYEDGLNLVAKLPQISAHVINHHAGWKGTAYSPEQGYMENFVQMLGVPQEVKENFSQVMRIFNILHFDHGGGNLSTFVGKAVASGLEEMSGSISAAMNALAGPRHGKANQDCLEFVKSIFKDLGSDVSIEDLETFIQKKLDNRELIFGFGHAVLRVEDPRATVQYDLAQTLYPENDLVKVALKLREAGPRVLGKNPKVSNPYPNVDAISGTLLTACGFPYPEYYTVLFGMSRGVGIAKQIIYERNEARGGKGTPIIRPKYLFKTDGNDMHSA